MFLLKLSELLLCKCLWLELNSLEYAQETYVCASIPEDYSKSKAKSISGLISFQPLSASVLYNNR